MALKVWLPLNGSLENKGLSDTIVVNNNATVDSAGKIGQCYSLASGNYLGLDANNVNKHKYSPISLAVWFYPTQNDSTERLILNCFESGGSGLIWQNQKACFEIYVGGYKQCWTTTTITLNTWHHICGTYDGATMSLYVDGALANTNAVSGTITYHSTCPWAMGSNPGATSFGSGNLVAKLNDIRIYDHCLSALEVKEIAQGLVAHYKLDGCSGGVGENLLLKTNQGTTKWGFNIGNKYNQPTKQEIKWLGVRALKATMAALNTDYTTTWHLIYYDDGNLWKILEPSTTYILSFDSTVQHTNFALKQSNGTNDMATSYTFSQVQKTDENGETYWHNTGTFTTLSSFTGSGQYVYISSNMGYMDTAGTVVKYANIKLEKGSTATPWSPAPADLGIDTTKITDSSGYGNDGTATGTITTEANSKRYATNTIFNANIINSPAGAVLAASKDFTITGWFYHTSGTNYYASAESYNTSVCLESARFFVYPSSGSAYVGTWTCANNTWQMVTLVHNSTAKTLTLFVNGAQTAQVSTNGTIYANNTLNIGGRQNSADYVGKMADFRIYATALSAEDILALYHTPTNVDNLGNFHTFEFTEDNDNSVSQNGITHTNMLKQYSSFVYPEYDNGLYFEPDGSAWVHIYHHNNPGAGSFASTDTFATGVYKDANRWFDGTRVCNSLTKWEFLVKYAFTAGGTEYKQRWIQTINPESAAFADVAAANITRITENGYATSSWGGLYKKNGSAYWVQNNGTSGNWWGATGPFSVYQNGSPSYGGTVTTTGYDDLYVRVDNLDFSDFTHASITEEGFYLGRGFIEK